MAIIVGDADANQIQGTAASDVIDAGGRKDVVRADAGNDVVDGGANQDRLYGDAGDDVMNGGGSDDKVYGGEGSDILFGGGQNDRIYGGNGNDKIIGGDDDDVLYGDNPEDNGMLEGTVDKFFFDETDGNDKILDFEVGLDQIQLSGGTSYTLTMQGQNTLVTYGSTTIVVFNAQVTDADVYVAGEAGWEAMPVFPVL